MRNKVYILITLSLVYILPGLLFGQATSFMVLGDLHIDKFEYHDLDYVRTRPQDYKQIFNEYPQYTAFFIPKLFNTVKQQNSLEKNKLGAVVQLGDLVQGVSGNANLARKMNREAIDMLYELNLNKPWVLVKGNHDVSNSPYQPEVWSEVIRPFIESQVQKNIQDGMYSFQVSPEIELFISDQFFSKDKGLDERSLYEFLKLNLKNSKAKYKFLLTHQPVIPVTPRCWHLFGGSRREVKDSTLRDNFLELLATNKVIVLTGHLHEYSVLSRTTLKGNIVQVMLNSVIKSEELPEPKNYTSEYKGGQWIDENINWEPKTADKRRKILEKEKPFIKSFFRTDLPGYGIIEIKNNEILLHFYNGWSMEVFQTINLSELQKLI